MQFIIISCPSCPKHLASFRQSFPDKRGARWSQGAGKWPALGDKRRSRWLWPEQRVCRGGFSSDWGSGVSCSLNRCCTWPCVVGACHNSGSAGRPCCRLEGCGRSRASLESARPFGGCAEPWGPGRLCSTAHVSFCFAALSPSPAALT